MITIKESILSHSSHGAKGFDAQRRELIEKRLKEYDIENYTINDDFTIDVDGEVNILKKNLKEVPEYIQCGVVQGSFDCSRNNLTTLNGTPKEVKEYFFCSFNNLTSLKGAPEKVGGSFDCQSNKLTSLEGAPEEVGRGFYCTHNHTQFTDDDVRKVCNVRRLIIC